MEEQGIDTDRFPPVAVMSVMTSVSQILVLEEALGMSAGHAENARWWNGAWNNWRGSNPEGEQPENEQ